MYIICIINIYIYIYIRIYIHVYYIGPILYYAKKDNRLHDNN